MSLEKTVALMSIQQNNGTSRAWPTHNHILKQASLLLLSASSGRFALTWRHGNVYLTCTIYCRYITLAYKPKLLKCLYLWQIHLLWNQYFTWDFLCSNNLFCASKHLSFCTCCKPSIYHLKQHYEPNTVNSFLGFTTLIWENRRGNLV
jgi:hypothetical protein